MSHITDFTDQTSVSDHTPSRQLSSMRCRGAGWQSAPRRCACGCRRARCGWLRARACHRVPRRRGAAVGGCRALWTVPCTPHGSTSSSVPVRSRRFSVSQAVPTHTTVKDKCRSRVAACVTTLDVARGAVWADGVGCGCVGLWVWVWMWHVWRSSHIMELALA